MHHSGFVTLLGHLIRLLRHSKGIARIREAGRSSIAVRFRIAQNLTPEGSKFRLRNPSPEFDYLGAVKQHARRLCRGLAGDKAQRDHQQAWLILHRNLIEGLSDEQNYLAAAGQYESMAGRW